MAFYRKFYKRYYKKKYNNSARSLKMSRNFKASAANMTQRGKFNINVHDNMTLTVSSNAQSAMGDIDIAALCSSSAMHAQLSNVFDQYKISKVIIKIRPIGSSVSNPSEAPYSQTFFTVVDRTGFAATVDITTLRTYQSYKEIVWGFGSTETPNPMIVSVANTSLVEKSSFADTKTTASFPKLKVGIYLPAAPGSTITTNYSIEVDAMVTYRGVRLDTSSVLPPSPSPTPSAFPVNFCLGTWNNTSQSFESQILIQVSSSTTITVPSGSTAYLLREGTGPAQESLWIVSIYYPGNPGGTLTVEPGAYYYVKSGFQWVYVLDASDLSPLFYLTDSDGDTKKTEAMLAKSAFEYSNPEN